MGPGDGIAVVIVTFDHAEEIGDTLRSVLVQMEDGDELLVVDNGSHDGTVAAARAAAPAATVLEANRNLGFAVGCNEGARHTSAPLLFFLNPDARLDPGCLDALRKAAQLHSDWAAWQPLITLPGGDRVNTWGNDTHFLGVGWAGGCGRSVLEAGTEDREVSVASGAALVVRRTAWDTAGGFDPGYFTYSEDLDLSLRLRLMGHEVGMTPSARVTHDYEFHKGDYKWFLIERNRWRTLLRVYPTALLMLLAPALVLFELVLLVVATRQRWLRAKLRALGASVLLAPSLLRDRRAVQSQRRVTVHRFAVTALSDSLESEFLELGGPSAPLHWLQRFYWRLVIMCLYWIHRS